MSAPSKWILAAETGQMSAIYYEEAVFKAVVDFLREFIVFNKLFGVITNMKFFCVHFIGYGWVRSYILSWRNKAVDSKVKLYFGRAWGQKIVLNIVVWFRLCPKNFCSCYGQRMHTSVKSPYVWTYMERRLGARRYRALVKVHSKRQDMAAVWVGRGKLAQHFAQKGTCRIKLKSGTKTVSWELSSQEKWERAVPRRNARYAGEMGKVDNLSGSRRRAFVNKQRKIHGYG
jgi:hypothetical protein